MPWDKCKDRKRKNSHSTQSSTLPQLSMKLHREQRHSMEEAAKDIPASEIPLLLDRVLHFLDQYSSSSSSGESTTHFAGAF
jgi:hypothetical protein